MADSPARPSGVASLSLLLPFLRPYLARAGAAAFALLAAAGLTLAVGQGLRRIIDDGFTGGPAALDQAALVMAGIIAALGFATAARYYLVTWLGERVAADLRRAVFDHLTRLDARFYETARTGDLMSRLTADVALLQSLIGSAISMGLRNALTGIGAFVMLVLTSAKLAGIMAVVVPLVVLPMIAFGRRERRLSRTAQERVADLAATAEEAINGMRTVQAFTHEDLERNRIRRGIRTLGPGRTAARGHAHHADPERHPAGLRCHHLLALGGRAGCDLRADDRRRPHRLRVLCRALGQRGGHGQRVVGRDPARRGRRRPVDGSARGAARHHAPRGAAAAAGPARHRGIARRDLPVSVPPRHPRTRPFQPGCCTR